MSSQSGEVELSASEQTILTQVKVLAHMTDPHWRTLSTGVIAHYAWDDGRGMTYTNTCKLLSSLARKGAIRRVIRGYYALPREDR